MRQTPIVPLGVALVAALLASCGGGSGPATKVSSSPSTAGTTSADTTPANPEATHGAPTGNPVDGSSTPTGPATGREANPDGAMPLSAWVPMPLDAPVGAGNADAPDGTAPTPPVSASGIRGDVFLAMLSQKPCGGDWIQPVHAPDGSFLSEGLLLINADASLNNYEDLPTHRPDPSADTSGHPLTTGSLLGCNAKRFAPARPGKTVYTMSQLVHTRFFRPPKGFHVQILSIPTEVKTDMVTMSREAVASVGMFFHKPGQPRPEAWDRYETPSLAAERELSVRLDKPLGYGVVQQWTEARPASGQAPQLTRLMLLKGTADDQVRFCWHTHLHLLKRLQCIVWSVPADWRPPQPLKLDYQELIEDRSVYPDEQGLAYWRGRG